MPSALKGTEGKTVSYGRDMLFVVLCKLIGLKVWQFTEIREHLFQQCSGLHIFFRSEQHLHSFIITTRLKLRQYRTTIVRKMCSQIFRQIA